MKNVVVLRHGQQAINELHLDDPIPTDEQNGLTEQGLAQAESAGSEMARALRGANSVRVITSPALRCTQTADIVGRAMGFRPDADKRLLDRLFDPTIHKTIGQLREWQNLGWLDPHLRVGSAESVSDHRGRVQSLVNEIVNARDELQIVVAHGATIEHLAAVLLGISVQGMETAYLNCGHCRFHLWNLEATPAGHLGAELMGVNLPAQALSNMMRNVEAA